LDIRKIFENQKRNNSIPSHKERIEKIKNFLNFVLENKKELAGAIYKDFGKSEEDVYLTELLPFTLEARHAIKNLKNWLKPQRIKGTMALFGAKGKIQFRPKGVVLIISPWNYPFTLAAGPVISALAAGNKIILKPSEKTPHTSLFLKKLISEIFPANETTVVLGGAETAKELLKLPFDHVFFTGGTKIGSEIMKAAAENLTPVTLELGGKSPAIIDQSSDIKIAAEKITWGKLLNAGQTCIAPDYVLIRKNLLPEFIKEVKLNLNLMYNFKDGKFTNIQFCKIVNDESFERLKYLLKDALNYGANIAIGSESINNNRVFPPTILTNVSLNSRIMKEEIFGPLLPVITFETIKEALEVISFNPNPLSFYIFSKRRNFINTLSENVNTGGIVINDVVINFIHTNLPFGGIKTSGLGKAHGYYGFVEFSNLTPVLKQFRLTPIKLLYPPYNNFKRLLIDFLLKHF